MSVQLPVLDDSPSAAALRSELADSLVDDGTVRSVEVEAAFRKVPRHWFAPEASLEDAYARSSVVVKRDADGQPISTVSDPHIQAVMLEQAQISPGMRVLEVGSGGYNAALLAELTGPDGQVTSVDLDPEVTGRATGFLTAAGYSQVNVVLADAEAGMAVGAPYDRILVTAGAWDIPPAWIEQLALPSGRIVVPLRVRGVTRTVALDREGDGLVGRVSAPCGFVPMQGRGAHREHIWPLAGGQVEIVVDDGDPDLGILTEVLSTGHAESWSGVMIGRAEPFNHLFLWYATSLPGFVRLNVNNGPESVRLAETGERFFPFSHADSDSLAYMTVRPSADASRVEIGARAFGPHGHQVADAMCDAVRVWDEHHRRGPGPVYYVFPAGTSDDRLPDGYVIDKRHSRIVISWPASG